MSTRSIDGETKKFKKGAAILSVHLGAPIVPAAFEGAFDVWPRNRALRWSAFLPWKRTRIKLRFGEVLAPPAAPGGSAERMETYYTKLAGDLRNVVVEMQIALRREPPAVP